MKGIANIISVPVLLLGTLLFPQNSFAANWHVSKNGNNTKGTSWPSAWNEMNQINWDAVQAGDTIFIDGGTSSMRYYTPLTVGRGGTNSARITISRSEDENHNGIVYLGSTIYVEFPYITIDGKDRDRFIIDYSDGGYIVRNPPGGNYFEFKNISLNTAFKETTPWGTPFYSNALNVLIKSCKFIGTNNEDQIKYNGTDGTLTIENSYFSGLTNHGAIHEDVVQVDVPGVNLIVRRNFFTNNGNDCFMMASGRCPGDCYLLGNLEFYYNVFSGVGDAIKADSARSLKVYNNVFDSCRDILISSTPIDSRNNIYTGTSWSGPVHVHSGSTYSISDIGTEHWYPGQGNIQAAPLFKDKANGDYSLQQGSPAINAGTDVGLSADILGNPINGLPDIGAYEYGPGGDTTPPGAPTGLAVN